MEVAVLLGAVFVGLVGLAFWFGRRTPRSVTTTPSTALPDTAPEPVPSRGPVVDEAATGEPATRRDEANRPSTVFAAAATGHVRGLRDLLDANPMVSRLEQMDERGWTALHHAAYHDQIPCIRLLLERNANVDAVAEGECVPLHMAAAQGSVETLTLLLDGGADVDTPDESGATPLHYAALPGRRTIVETLLARGAQPNMKNGRRETPLDLASRLDDTAVADALRAAGGQPGEAIRMIDILPLLGDRPIARQVPSNWHLDVEGPELTAAHARAQEALPMLLAHLEDHPEAPVAVQFPLTADDLVEYVWGEVLAREADEWTVRLSAPPVAVPVPDDPVTVALDQIADWQIRLADDDVRGPGKRAGGYTQRATYEAILAEYGFLPPSVQEERDRLVDL